MHLAAHALGLSSLWFTLFDKKTLREMLGIAPEKTPLALICIGKPGILPTPVPRKEVKEKTIYIR
jgi:nitroreductase